MYAFSENFILPLSHDEIVHGKKSLLAKMPGDRWQQFANLRLLYTYMWMHPGKKLLFMGGEFGQWNEWYCKRSLDWHLVEETGEHEKLLTFIADLNDLYLANVCLYEQDFHPDGFRWMDLEDRDNSVIVFSRHGKNPADHLVAAFNFTPQPLINYRIPLPENRDYGEIFCSDSEIYGGTNGSDMNIVQAVAEPHAQADFHAVLTVPPLAGVILKPV